MPYDRNGVWNNNIEHRPYTGDYIKDTMTLLGCIGILVLIVICCIASHFSTLWIARMLSPKAFVAGSTWQGSLLHDSDDGGLYMSRVVLLHIDTIQGNSFSGRMQWYSYEYGEDDLFTTITGHVISAWSQDDLQITFVEARSPLSNNYSQSVRYTATVSLGAMDGTWCCGSYSTNGKFNLTRHT